MLHQTVNAWISDNAAKLRHRLTIYCSLDEDAFQEAYLTLAMAFRAPESARILEAAFLKAYRQLANRNIGESFTMSHPDELFFTLLPSDDTEPMEEPEETKDIASLARRVRRHIRASFPRIEVMVFEMRIKGFSCRDITDTMGIGTAAINNITEQIIIKARSRFARVAL